MPTFTIKKNLFLPILLFSFFSVKGQDKKGLHEASVGTANFKTFTSKITAPDQEWLEVNKEFASHPDAKHVAPDNDYIEVLQKRTLEGKYYINRNDHAAFQIEKGSMPMHYIKDGQFLTIDTRLTKISDHILEASRQGTPVGFDLQRKASYIKVRNEAIYFNNWSLYGSKNGTLTVLAQANWSNYTAGDDGMKIMDIFPGIDAEMKINRGSVKTNFIVNSNRFPGYDYFKFKDMFEGGTRNGNGLLQFADGSAAGTNKLTDVNYRVNQKNILRIEKGIAYRADNGAATHKVLGYDIQSGNLFLNVDAQYLNTQLSSGKVIIDPMVSVQDTAAMVSPNNYSMNCGSVTNSCNRTLSITPPAGATITKVYCFFQIQVISPASFNQSFFGIQTNGACGLTYGTTVTGSGTLGTPDSTRNGLIGYDSITSWALPCIPGPSCTPAPIVFTLRLFNTYCAAGPAGCSDVYNRGLAPGFIIKLTGVTFDPKKITRTSDTAICQGSSVTLGRTASFGVPPYRYTWLPGGQTTPTITVSPLVTTTYTSIITDSCGNSSTDTTTVNVVTQTVAPAVVSPQTVCQYGNVPLTAGGTNLRWWTTATGGVASSIAPVPPNTPGTYNYYVSSQTKCGETPRAHIQVTVLPKPAPPTVVSPLGVCQYAQLQLTATGQNLKWYVTPTGSVGQPVLVPNTNYVDSYYYYVTQTINGCESDRARLRLDVNYKPNGIILASRLFVCEGDTASFKYYGNALPDAYYNWSLTGPVFNEIVSGQGTQGPLIVRFDSSGLRQVRVQVNNRGCLSEIATQSLSVRPNPKIAYVVKQEACQHEVVNVALNAISPLIDSFHYSFPGAQIVYGAASGGPYGITYHNPGQYVISSMSFARECPSRFYYDTITVRPLPDARFNVSSNQICAGDSVLFTARNTDSNTQFYWTPDNFFSSGNIYRSWGVVKNNAYIKLRAVSRYGCIATDSAFIKADACCDLFFPNAFSPNKDGKNDIFRPVTLGHQEIKTFRILNRWGQVVFETKGDRIGWDGTYNGKEQDNGTYFYYIRYRCNDSRDDLEQKGEVILVR